MWGRKWKKTNEHYGNIMKYHGNILSYGHIHGNILSRTNEQLNDG
jgi:hypothetical protein